MLLYSNPMLLVASASNAASDISEWILDEDMITGSVSEADMAMLYNLLLVINEQVTRIVVIATFIFALILFVFVFRLVFSIFNKI